MEKLNTLEKEIQEKEIQEKEALTLPKPFSDDAEVVAAIKSFPWLNSDARKVAVQSVMSHLLEFGVGKEADATIQRELGSESIRECLTRLELLYLAKHEKYRMKTTRQS